ncbi:MAG: uracil-DNA glycosylase family protein [bacterium]
MKTNETVSKFFEKYKRDCEKFNRGPIHIPKPDPENGVPGENIILMFINERPGRVGPGQTDLISYDKNPDPTAARFKRLFETLEINRKKIFITNACIYYPREENYTDRAPTTEEIIFSAGILKDQIERVNPKIIIPLGNTALRTLKIIYPDLRHRKLKTDVAKLISVSRLIFPLYHTSNRANTTRSEESQKKDWVRLKNELLQVTL